MKIGDTLFVCGHADLIASDDEFKGLVHQAFETAGKGLPLLGVLCRETCLISRSRWTTHFCLAKALIRL